ncbi:hypothetical protein [Neorhizobium sp. DAR64861/K0K2]|uniref:hypothetical protein n=1 Tax=unclassified Neorhizobium TaxID=2629175 RepID=UPI003D2E984E
MSPAILALWNDYPATMAEEYEAWHTFEHVPERLTVPGMRAARRYVSAAGKESYFTLYELESLAVIEQPSYLDLVRNPTPWSQKMRQHFSSVLRIPGEIAVKAGSGIGGATLVQAYSVESGKAHASIPMMEEILRQLMTQTRITGFQVVLAEPNQVYEVFEQDEATDPDTVNVVIIAEGTSVEALSVTQAALTRQIEHRLEPRKRLRSDLFKLLISYRGEDFPSHRSEIDTNTMWHSGDHT